MDWNVERQIVLDKAGVNTFAGAVCNLRRRFSFARFRLGLAAYALTGAVSNRPSISRETLSIVPMPSTVRSRPFAW